MKEIRVQHIYFHVHHHRDNIFNSDVNELTFQSTIHQHFNTIKFELKNERTTLKSFKVICIMYTYKYTFTLIPAFIVSLTIS